jgi:hypothetical protein
MAGRKTAWAFRDKGMRRLLKKKEIRAEEKQWQDEEIEIVCCVQECQFPDCDCEELDQEG